MKTWLGDLYGVVQHEASEGEEWDVGACDFIPPERGNRRGHPDTWEPDDGGELGELVALRNGEELGEAEMEARWGVEVVKDLRDRVWDAAVERAGDDGRDCDDYEPPERDW